MGVSDQLRIHSSESRSVDACLAGIYVPCSATSVAAHKPEAFLKKLVAQSSLDMQIAMVLGSV